PGVHGGDAMVSDSGRNETALAERVQRLEDLLAIHQLFVDYGQLLDAGDFDAYANLFAEDGELLLGPVGRAKGRAAIKELMSKNGGRQGASYHIISSPQVALEGDRATARVMWSVVARMPDGSASLTMVGHHEDALRRDPD